MIFFLLLHKKHMLWVLIRIALESTHNIYFHGARRIILVLFVLEKVHCLKLRVCYSTKLRCWMVTNKYHIYFLSRKEKVREKTRKFTELLQSADCKVGVITSKKLEGHIAFRTVHPSGRRNIINSFSVFEWNLFH